MSKHKSPITRLRSARGTLSATLRHHPERGPQLKPQIKEASEWLTDAADVREAAAIWKIYSATLQQKNKLKGLSKTQARSAAVQATAKKCGKSERHVRRIVTEWTKL
jgi:hypothetical protein